MGVTSGNLYSCSRVEGISGTTTNSRSQIAIDRLGEWSITDEFTDSDEVTDNNYLNVLPEISIIRKESRTVSMALCSPDPEKWDFSLSKVPRLETHKQSIDVYASKDQSRTLSYGVILCKSFLGYHQNRDKIWVVKNLED